MVNKRVEIVGGGFLGAPLPDISRAAPGADAEGFAMFLETIKLADRVARAVSVIGQETAEDRQRVIALLTLIRLKEVAEAIAVLASHGVREELNSLYRVFLDAYFVHANCCQSADFIPAYFRSDLPARVKLMNAAAKHSGELFRLVNEYAEATVKEKLSEEITTAKIDAFNSHLFAKNAGCEEIYDSIYRIQSASVHTTPRCLEHYVAVDSEGNILQILHGPNAVTTNQVVHDISNLLVNAIAGFAELFDMSLDTELGTLRAILRGETTR